MTSSMRRIPQKRLGMSATDRAFDRLLPDDLRRLSDSHWTPVDIAIRATSLLCPASETRILDVGSGVGKLCVVGAMSSEGLWCGVEQHAALVHTARELAGVLDVAERTMFLHGDALALDWREFDAIYLYNPFEIPLFEVDHAQHLLDFRVQVARVQERLATLRERARVVTLHGFGGVMPPSYELVYHERIAVVGLDLVLWVQRARAREIVDLA
jgi:SAM-dependent methyltransferase